ncbi:MAG TPA: CpaD family pilus assembly protein [Caulobacterales bacterium]|nr:CpaD family pilus assembly protein [Caulobacterales bacterium]
MNARLSLLLASVATLGACATAKPPPGPPIASAADRHHIDVEQTGARLDIPVAKDDVALSDQSRGDLDGFASAYLRAGHGAMILSTPSGGDNGDAAALVAQQTRLALIDRGVPYAAIAGSTYDASGQSGAPIVLRFTNYEAHAPNCTPLYEQDLAHQSNNQPWASFGCATQANLAAMIEDPHDLLAPRTEDPRDGGRRETVFTAYRAGQPTGAQRTDDERAAISNAVQ